MPCVISRELRHYITPFQPAFRHIPKLIGSPDLTEQTYRAFLNHSEWNRWPLTCRK